MRRDEWPSPDRSKLLKEGPVLVIHQTPNFCDRRRQPANRFGSFRARVPRVNRTHIKRVVRMSMNIYILKVPHKCRIRTLVHVGKMITLSKSLVIAERGTDHPWPAARVLIFPCALRSRIKEEDVRETANGFGRLLQQFACLIRNATRGHPVIFIPVDDNFSGSHFAG